MHKRGRRGRGAIAAGLAVVFGLSGVTDTTPALAATPSAEPRQCAPPATNVIRDIPWPQHRLPFQSVWSLTTGQDVTVAVIDTGVDATVPQLAGHVRPGTDVLGGGTADRDCSGHGTFVAGIIAAQPVRGIGFTGVAPGARILPVRQSDDNGDGRSSGLAKAIRAAVDAGAQVINISGAATRPSDPLRAAVSYALGKNVVVVAAAANDAQQGNPTTYPAAYPGVIAVGSIDEDGSRSDFSETGSFVDLVAPGSNVVSLGTGGPGHLTGQGTSYATPFVAGVAALIRAYRPGLSPAQVKHRLEVTADHAADGVPDEQVGYGVVNPVQAVTADLPEGAAAAPVGRARVPVRITVPGPVPADTAPQHVGLLAGLGALGLGLMIAIGVAMGARGHRRHWRPGRVEENPEVTG